MCIIFLENGASSYKIKIRTTINPCEAPQVTSNSYSRNKNQTAAILVFGKAYNEETFYNNLTINSQKIGVTTRSMSKGNEFLTSKPAGESDKGVSLTSGRSTSAMKHKPNETASEKLAVNRTKVNLFLVRKQNLAQLESQRARQKQNQADGARLAPVQLLT